MDDEVWVALVIIEDDVDLWIHPVVHTRVKKVTGGVTGVDGWRPPHGGIPNSKPADPEKDTVSLGGWFWRLLAAGAEPDPPSSQDLGQEHAVDPFRRALGEVVGIDGLACEVGALAEHGGVLAAHPRVKIVLADAFDDVCRGAVEEVALAQQTVHLGHPPRHVLLLPVGEK